MLSFLLALATTASAKIESQWNLNPGMTLNQLQLDPSGSRVCGVKKDGSIYCADTANYSGWWQLPGKLTQVTTANGRIFGVNFTNDISYSASNSDGKAKWVHIPGKLKQISYDGFKICGTNAQDQIMCADKNITTTPNWFTVPGSLREVVVQGQKLYGFASNNTVWYSPSYKNVAWTMLKGQGLSKLQFDGVHLCGIDSFFQLWCADSGLESKPNWNVAPIPMKQVSVVRNGLMLGIFPTDPVLTATLPPSLPAAIF